MPEPRLTSNLSRAFIDVRLTQRSPDLPTPLISIRRIFKTRLLVGIEGNGRLAVLLYI